jgi:hemolysin type calcium-binding protein
MYHGSVQSPRPPAQVGEVPIFPPTVPSSRYADSFKGGPLNDTFSGAGGADTVLGRAGNDTLNDQGGNDDLNGGLGTDVCTQGPGSGTVINCDRDVLRAPGGTRTPNLLIRSQTLYPD